MKNNKLLITVYVFFVLLSDKVYTQNSWIIQDSVPGYGVYYGLDFLNEFTGYCSGTYSRIRKTTNGGQNWFSLSGSDSASYNDVFIVNNNIIFVTTFGDNIYKSTNSGNNWTGISATPGGYSMRSIFMYNENIGYLLAGNISAFTSSILKTTNGGINWTTVLTASNSIFYEDAYCFDLNNAIVSGNLSVFKTTDAGQIWTRYYPFTIPPIIPTYLHTIEFINNQTGFTAGEKLLNPPNKYPAIYKTTNGGINWTEKLFPQYPGGNIESLSFADSNNGFAVGDSGTIFRTTNMGNTWIKQKRMPFHFKHVSFRTINKAAISGFKAGCKIIFATTDGGWDPPLAPELIFPPNNTSYLNLTPIMDWQDVEYNAAVYRLQISLDSNFNSFILNINNTDTSGYVIPSNILTANNTYYWRVRSENPLYNSSWSSVWKFNTNAPVAPNLINPLNNDTTVIPMQLFDWTDATSSVSYKSQISRDSVFSQIIIDTTCTISQFNSSYGKLIWNTYYYWRARANNYAGTGPWSNVWKFKTSFNHKPTLIVPNNNDTGILYNRLFNWENFPNATYYRIQFSSDSTFNSILYDFNIYSSLYNLKLSMLPNTYYYWRVNATSGSGISFWSESRKFKTSSIYSGIGDNEIIPSEYLLFNCYPNPFNPVTNIKFQIPQSGNVSLKVYDNLGKEIRTLIQQGLNAGYYETKFNAENLPSGVYFYKLTTDGFSDVKKMVVVK